MLPFSPLAERLIAVTSSLPDTVLQVMPNQSSQTSVLDTQLVLSPQEQPSVAAKNSTRVQYSRL